LLTQPLGQQLADQARINVARPARRKPHNDAYWSRRIALRGCNARDDGKGDSTRGQMQKLPSVESFTVASYSANVSHALN
jgi:hypothetical protein